MANNSPSDQSDALPERPAVSRLLLRKRRQHRRATVEDVEPGRCEVPRVPRVGVLAYALLDNHFHLLVRVPERESVPDDEFRTRVEALYGHDRAAKLFDRWDRWTGKGRAAEVALERDRLPLDVLRAVESRRFVRVALSRGAAARTRAARRIGGGDRLEKRRDGLCRRRRDRLPCGGIRRLDVRGRDGVAEGGAGEDRTRRESVPRGDADVPGPCVQQRAGNREQEKP